MPEEKAELGWADLMKMVAEVGSENGPGSKAWKAEGSETKRVNEQFMRDCARTTAKYPANSQICRH